MHTYTCVYRYKQQMEKKILPGLFKSPLFFAACRLHLLHRRQLALNHLKTRHLIRTQTNCTSLVMSVLAIRSWPWPAQQNKETVPSSATQSKISWVYLPCSCWGVAQIHTLVSVKLLHPAGSLARHLGCFYVPRQVYGALQMWQNCHSRTCSHARNISLSFLVERLKPQCWTSQRSYLFLILISLWTDAHGLTLLQQRVQLVRRKFWVPVTSSVEHVGW